MEFTSSSDRRGAASDGLSSMRVNTLAREGIVPIKEQRATAGSRFGQAAPRAHFSSDQRKSYAEITDSVTVKSQLSAPPSIAPISILPRQIWMPFGDGWFQATTSDSGKRTKYGLHCVIESAPRRVYLCCYLPQTSEVYEAITSPMPYYDIEVSAKAMTTNANRVGDICLVLGYSSASKYLCVKCDINRKFWSVILKFEDFEETLCLVPMDSVKVNCFYDYLLQVRGDTFSLDVNTLPLFTAVKVPEGVSLGGLVGVLAADSKFALKNWKFRAASNSHLRRMSASMNPSTNAVGKSPYRNSQSKDPIEQHFHNRNMSLNPTSGYPDSSPIHPSRTKAGRSTAPDKGYEHTAGMNSNPNIPEIDGGKSRKPKSLSELMGIASAPSRSDSTVLSPTSKTPKYYPSYPQYAEDASSALYSPPIEPEHPPDSRQLSYPHYSHQDSNNQRYAGSGIGTNSSHSFNSAPYDDLSNVRNKMNSYVNNNRSTSTSWSGQVDAPVLTPSEQKAREISSLLCSRHDKHIVETVLRDVIQRDLGVTFDDIAAVPVAKRLLHEAVILPLIMPEFFTGIREPWKGVLLFGPPGTGKTMLAKAVAGVNGSTFFSCSAASLISKYRGESEKIIKCLFEAARLYAPSIIFLDEVDALVSSRGAEGEHEASRRLKTEIFSEMDGIASSGCQSVMLLATTNCPWDLDEAMRRRLEKRIYIPLPDEAARAELFSLCMRSVDVDSDRVQPELLALETEGYSGADIRIICREAAMMPMRRLLLEKRPDEIQRLRASGELVISKVQLHDFLAAIQNTSPSVSSTFDDKYLAWDKEFGTR